MKKFAILISFIPFVVFISCNFDPGSGTSDQKSSEPSINKSIDIESKEYTIINDESKINWTAQGVGHGHNGFVTAKSGSFAVENGKITKGEMTIDMTSIAVLDIEDAKKNRDLTKHIKSKDFFDVEEFPVSSIEILDASDMDSVIAILTIKDHAQEISFPLEVSVLNDKVILNSKLKIDRTKFGIVYNSGNFFQDLGDYLIEDLFDLEIALVSK